MVLVVLAIYAKAGAIASTRPISDFYAGGRAVPAMLNGVAIAACFIGLVAFAAVAGCSSQGWEGLVAPVMGGAGGLVVIALFLAPSLHKFGGFTLPDFLGERFGGTAVRPLAVLVVILCSFPALTLVLLCIGHIAMRVFGVDAGTGVALGVAMLLFCTFAAGMRSATLTQIAQYAVLLAASLVALAIVLWQHGASLSALGGSLRSEALSAFRLEAFTAEDPINRVALAFCVAAGTASLPHLLMRGFTAPSAEAARTSFLWALPLIGVLCLVAPAFVSLIGEATVTSSDAASLTAFGLAAIGAMAACLALGSALVLAIANALSYDIYYTALHRTASTDRRLLIARGGLVLVAGLGAIAALAAPQTMLTMTGASFSLAASALLPALLLGIWWKRATAEGALAGMLAGLGVCLYYMLATRYIPFAFYETSSFLSNATQEQAAAYDALRQSYYLADEAVREGALAAWKEAARAVANWWGIKQDFAALFAVPIGSLVAVGTSLFTPAPSKDVQSFVEDLRKPSVA